MTSSSRTLKKYGLRVTPVREQVMRLFIESGTTALSNGDIEKSLKPLDRITLYRTLRVFEQKGIIHTVVGQKGTIKYASCSANCEEHSHQDDHAHFHCVDCETTMCLPDTKLPRIDVPSGFQAVDKQVILSGRCDNCQE